MMMAIVSAASPEGTGASVNTAPYAGALLLLGAALLIVAIMTVCGHKKSG